jgi:hypothetical protein
MPNVVYTKFVSTVLYNRTKSVVVVCRVPKVLKFSQLELETVVNLDVACGANLE